MARTRRNTSPALEAFHPAVKRWFASRFETVTPPQAKGWPAIREGRDTLIAAPTGSGKTLSAFLNTIDALVRQGVDAPLPDQTQVLYVSPLKALSNDIRKNLSEPLAGIREALEAMGVEPPEIRVLVRTGDTKASERAAMVKRPPHILVTTPESLYILLTSAGGRKMLETVRTVIVDEIHAVARDRRGAHLALSLERLDALVTANAPSRPVRIGLSATQRPIEEMARFLIGAGHTTPDGAPDCAIVDEGHARTLDLGLELPSEPMSAVMSNETWEEVYDRLAALVRENRTTLIFTNTRRLAERLSMHLTKRLGEGLVTSHHGSLSREQRLDAEERLKAGSLRALVATASLELGIDIGDIDLVCQIGSTRAIATLLQRVGRSGHTLGGTPKGRLFPTTRDDLMECIALLLAARRGKLDRLTVPEKPLDVLAQQIVAAAAIEEWDETDVFDLARRAYPYRGLTREEFDDVVKMLAEGFSTRLGRGGGRIHYDGVNRRIRARKGSRLAAVTSGGAIPENADYSVLLQPQGVMVGTVNEDFAIESMPGDIFQLGISAWRILKVSQGKVLVEDAHGLPPTIPFWLGEAPARTAELSEEVSALRAEIDLRLGAQQPPDLERVKDTAAWLAAEAGIEDSAAEQTVEYLAASKAALGVIPTQRSIVLERFFDESGGMQLVLHAPFGGRVNRAWGLALRKKFCRTFNQELQAAATEDNIVLSLGPQHSFPLNDVFHYLSSKSAREVLTQALLAAPMFEVRWRWNATRSLAVLRHERGKKVPPPLQRMRAGDLLAAVFPSQVACAENVAGDIEIPDHPLVRQTVDDCLHEAMDVDAFLDVLDRIENGELRPTAVDTVEPSPMAHEILSAKPYAFLDDAPLEERRAQAVMMRRTIDIESARDLGALDASAIALVREQAWPDPRDADELHDALALLGYATEAEAAPWAPLLAALTGERRAAKVTPADGTDTPPLWIAAERLPLFEAVFPSLAGDGGRVEPPIEAPERERARAWERGEALTELVRGRMESLGPMTARELAASIGLDAREIDAALAALEADGAVLRGAFTPRPANGATPPRRGGMVRPAPPRAHPPLHAGPFAQGDRAGLAATVHALPLRLAARRARDPAPGSVGAGQGSRNVAGLPGPRGRVGEPGAERPHGPLLPVVARRAKPDGAGRLGPALSAGGRRPPRRGPHALLTRRAALPRPPRRVARRRAPAQRLGPNRLAGPGDLGLSEVARAQLRPRPRQGDPPAQLRGTDRARAARQRRTDHRRRLRRPPGPHLDAGRLESPGPPHAMGWAGSARRPARHERALGALPRRARRAGFRGRPRPARHRRALGPPVAPALRRRVSQGRPARDGAAPLARPPASLAQDGGPRRDSRRALRLRVLRRAVRPAPSRRRAPRRPPQRRRRRPDPPLRRRSAEPHRDHHPGRARPLRRRQPRRLPGRPTRRHTRRRRRHPPPRAHRPRRARRHHPRPPRLAPQCGMGS